ncbi:MAG: allantoinase [Betaproteobacteria bacterium]|nr:allantoinase [Betaproteobacteria bacterium]
MVLPLADYRARDLVGYGDHPPKVEWPGGARLAVNVVVNYEAGGEPCVDFGDPRCETRGIGSVWGEPGVRDLILESFFEYGSRVGVWRYLDIFDEFEIKASFLAVGQALEMNPEVAKAIGEAGHEPVDHGYRWGYAGSLRGLSREQERALIRKNVETLRRLVGERPVGQFIGDATLQTRELLLEEGFLYDSNYTAGDLPIFVNVKGKKALLVPYSRTLNDGRFWRVNGFVLGEQYLRYGKEMFDRLYEESATTPKMMTIALHDRVCSQPGRAAAVAGLISYIKGHPGVWFARRDEIAKVWIEQFGSE